MPGAYVTLQSEIVDYVRLQSLLPVYITKPKLSTDDSKISKSSNFAIVSIFFLDGNITPSENSQKTLAFVKCKETFEEPYVSCEPIFSEISKNLSKKLFKLKAKSMYIDILWTGPKISNLLGS